MSRKPKQEQAKAILLTTQQQREIGQLLDKHLEDGGCVIAQVFADGLRVRVFAPQHTETLAAVFASVTGQPIDLTPRHSAFQQRGK